MSLNLLTTTDASAGMGIGVIIVYVVIIGLFFWLFISNPQKKEQKRMQQLLSGLEVGDAVCTTSGFYGVVIDIKEDTVIVEFGNNKNCRIPMQKTAISQVEKAEKN